MRLFTAAFIALLITAGPAFAAEPAAAPKANSFSFDDAFVRETPVNVSAGYILITNTSAQDDVLLGASADWAKTIQIHSVSVDKNGVMNMAPIAQLPIKKGETATLAPTGRHLMIFGLKDKLVAGQKRDITLNFAKAGAVTVSFLVQPVTYRGKAIDAAMAAQKAAAVNKSATPAAKGDMGSMKMDGMDHDAK